MLCFPNAKINLGLSVQDKRPDGMHNIETCMIPVPIFDILEVKKSNNFSINTVGVEPDIPSEDNIVLKAWKIISSIYNISPVEVYLYKNIPIGSGLGGGSSDATFFLKMVRECFSLKISDMELESIATKVGADCPFFVSNRSAMATGIGNNLKPINNPIYGNYLTIVYPGFSSITKNAYSQIDPKPGYNINEILQKDIGSWKKNLINDFEENVLRNHPEIFRIKEELYNLGAEYVALTGSGSSLYAVSPAPINCTKFNEEISHWCFPIQQ